MRYVNWLRRLISNSVEWFSRAASRGREETGATPGRQADYQDDVFYVAFLGPHV